MQTVTRTKALSGALVPWHTAPAGARKSPGGASERGENPSQTRSAACVGDAESGLLRSESPSRRMAALSSPSPAPALQDKPPSPTRKTRPELEERLL